MLGLDTSLIWEIVMRMYSQTSQHYVNQPKTHKNNDKYYLRFLNLWWLFPFWSHFSLFCSCFESQLEGHQSGDPLYWPSPKLPCPHHVLVTSCRLPCFLPSLKWWWLFICLLIYCLFHFLKCEICEDRDPWPWPFCWIPSARHIVGTQCIYRYIDIHRWIYIDTYIYMYVYCMYEWIPLWIQLFLP